MVSHVHGLFQTWVLLTNVPVLNQHIAKEIWQDYRHRWGIEGKWRFLKEEGLRIEDFKILSLEGIRRMVSIVLLAALLILNGRHFFPDKGLAGYASLGREVGVEEQEGWPIPSVARLVQGFDLPYHACPSKQEGLLEGLLELLDSL